MSADQDFANEHGPPVDRYDNVWVIDNGNHRVMKFTNDGEPLMTLGIKRQAGATEETFGRPANIAFGPNDELYVADGQGKSRVVKYDSKELRQGLGHTGLGAGRVRSKSLCE